MGKLHEKMKDEKEDMQITKEWLMGNCRDCRNSRCALLYTS